MVNRAIIVLSDKKMIEVNSVGFLRKRDINFKRKEIRVLWKVDSHANYIYFIPITFHALRF